MSTVTTHPGPRSRTWAARYTCALVCGGLGMSAAVCVGIVIVVVFDGPGVIAGVLGTLGALGGAARGAMVSVSVTVADDEVIVRNPLRTHTVAASNVERIAAGKPWLTLTSGWAPSLVTKTRDRPIPLAGLLVPLSQFQTRRPGLAGLLVPIWRFDGGRTPDATYRNADCFAPLAHIVEAHHIPVAPQWSRLLTAPT